MAANEFLSRDYVQEATNEVASLLADGYILLFQHYNLDGYGFYARLRHKRNGRVLSVSGDEFGYVIKRETKILKTEGNHNKWHAV